MSKSETGKVQDSSVPEHLARRAAGTPGWMKFVGPIASLKLTVGLLAFATFLVLVATLQQTRMDIWEVKKLHFGEYTESGFVPQLFVYMPLDHFVPPAWQSADWKPIPGGMWLPSGLLTMMFLLINLTAAHLFRFKLTASGGQLLGGLGAVVFGVAISAFVVWFNQLPTAVQGKMPPYVGETLWIALLTGLALIAGAVGRASLKVGSGWGVERVLMLLLSASMFGVLIYLVAQGKSAYIGDSGMRILWQLFQGSIAALVLLVGCSMLFSRRGGIVLLHAGIGLLMVNEIYVSLTNVEQKMFVGEGETVSFGIDTRATEFVVYEANGAEYEEGVSIPGRIFEQGELIQNDLLPFDIQCVEYIPNVSEYSEAPMMKKKATKGIGLKYVPIPQTAGTGTDANQRVDSPAAFVTLFSKNPEVKEEDRNLGTYLVGQIATQRDVFDSIDYKGKTYEIALRYKRIPKSYSVKMIDVNRENYVGTMTPKYFGSEFELIDHARETKTNQKIWMNNPLRYGPETFYQARYEMDRTGREYSEIQIVKNEGWMIPYLACMFVVIGMSGQLLILLRRHLKNSPARNDPSIPIADLTKPAGRLAGMSAAALLRSQNASHQKDGWKKWAVIGGVVLAGLFAVASLLRSVPRGPNDDGMDLIGLGKTPVAQGGRVLPLDTLARNTLRQFRGRETALDPSPNSKLGDKVTAVQWVADLMFGKEGWKNRKVFRVDDPVLRHALKLPRRKGYAYSVAEVENSIEDLDVILKETIGVDRNRLERFQLRAQDLASKFNTVRMLEFGLLEFEDQSVDDNVATLMSVVKMSDRSEMPLLLPIGLEDQDWSAVAVVSLKTWLDGLAEENDADSNREIAANIADEAFFNEIFEKLSDDKEREKILRSRVISRLVNIVRDEVDDVSETEIRKRAESFLEKMSREEYTRTFSKEEMALAQSIRESRISRIKEIESAIAVIEQLSDFEGFDKAKEIVGNWKLAAEAYRNDDAETFNQFVADNFDSTSEMAPKGFNRGKLFFEWLMNNTSPFFVTELLFIASIVFSLISWICLSPSFRKLSFGIIAIAVLLQTLGLVGRIYVSGRPPVTNLYSSAVFISWTLAAICLIGERFYRIGLFNLIASIGGWITLRIASNLANSGDTIGVMQAVLDTQFWLATHVVIISLGYTATYLACGFGVLYVVTGIATPNLDRQTRKSLVKVMHLVTMVALLLSFFGTVLGGLWADDSWGRFWGWDPKENGALMIVLWNAVVLHARWGGIVKDRGFAVLCVAGGGVVSWSWFAVNELGVGLHTYGLTEGTLANLLKFWSVVVLLIVVGLIPTQYWWSYKADKNSTA